MGARIRAFDWVRTDLGPIEGWPEALKTALSLILGAQMPMWIGWGPELLFLYNDAYVQVLGEAKHPWALGRPAAEVWAEIWDVCGPLAERVFRAGEAPFLEDVRLFMKRGERLDEVYYSFSYSPIRDESGQVAGLFCPNTEVTAKLLHARRRRTLSELATRALIEKTTAAACSSAAETLAKNPDDLPFALLYLAAPDGRLRLEQAVRLAPDIRPYSPQEVAPEAAAASAWPLFEVLRSGSTQVVAFAPSELLPRGLADQPVRQAVVLPVTAAGYERPLGVMVAGVNPTRVLDPEYSSFYELVAGQVATAIQNATAAEEERRRADALAALDRAKTAFFSNISHEFRTPLTLMLGPTEDALAGPEPALRGEALATVHRNALRLLKLVNGLLDFSRLEAGRMVASYEPVDLAALTVDVASSFRSAIERAGLRFEVEAPPLPGPVQVDRDMWEKIVLNLLSNALKFTQEGSIRVELLARGDQVALTVADTGSGIPREEMARVFERFHRIENLQARTHEGTGIGLALVQELTRLHGGEVTVESEVGRGTRFTVTIPRAQIAARGEAVREPSPRTRSEFVEEAERSAAAARSSSAGATAAAGHVLVADDNADMRDYLQRVLAEEWRVTAVADRAAAVEAARAAPPDLVLTDVMMPGLDGFQVLAALRADPRTRSIPVIMLSARAGEEARVDGLDAGADDYLVKPFSRRELLARVRAHVALARLRRQAERDLAELYALLMQVPAAITVCREPELRCVFQNAAGVALRDARDKPLREVWPADSECYLACVEAGRAGAVQVRREVPVTGAWGAEAVTTRYWDITCAPLRLADGEDGVIMIAFEVSDRVQVRREAEAGEERRRLAAEAAGSGMWRVDLRTRLETRDAQLNRMLGLPDVETTQPLDDFLQRAHPEDRPGLAAALEEATRGEGAYVTEARYVRPDGSVFWLRAVGRAIHDERGEAVALTGAAVDVTARKAAEAAQAAAQERLRAALEASAIGTYVWDLHADTVEVDEGVRQLFGFTAGEGGRIDEYTAKIHEADRACWLAGLARCAEEGAAFSEEYRVVRADGTVRWVIDKGRVSLDARGRPTHMAGAVVDITEQKRLAELALDASRAKDEFLAMLGHELRNPLAPIVTALQVMKLRDAAPPKEVEVIERQVQHLTRLVDDLLDISRVTRGLIDLKPERVALREVVTKALEIASPLMEQKGHYVSVSVPRELTVRADPVRLAQVFANLLTNAARYTQPGGRIAVTAAEEAGQVVARVIDDGCGISKELLGRIFDLFIQGKRPTRDRAEGGLGIGLALVRTLVQMHGGEVSAASEGPGRGSQFIVKLPAVEAVEAPTPEASRSSGAAVTASPGRRVLLVDDNVDAAELLSEALREFGYTVAIAHDGPQALALVQDFRPEVAVLDIGLPVMDGYELARRLRQRGLDDCRMIALTGYGQEEDQARSRDAGFAAHMIKPVDLRKLTAALTE